MTTPTTRSGFPADIWRAHYATPHGFRFWPAEELVRAVGSARGGVALEAGCGNGANLWFLAEHYDRVIGVDGCVPAIDAAVGYMRARGVADRVTFHCQDVRRLPLPDATADLVIDVLTSQHLTWEDHAAAYREYRRVLKPGGRFFLQHLGEPTTTLDATRIGPFTYDRLPALFPGVSPVCVVPATALADLIGTCEFAVAEPRQVSKTYAGGAIVTYHIVEATTL